MLSLEWFILLSSGPDFSRSNHEDQSLIFDPKISCKAKGPPKMEMEIILIIQNASIKSVASAHELISSLLLLKDGTAVFFPTDRVGIWGGRKLVNFYLGILNQIKKRGWRKQRNKIVLLECFPNHENGHIIFGIGLVWTLILIFWLFLFLS